MLGYQLTVFVGDHVREHVITERGCQAYPRTWDFNMCVCDIIVIIVCCFMIKVLSYRVKWTAVLFVAICIFLMVIAACVLPRKH